jgi:hypothetical protein
MLNFYEFMEAFSGDLDIPNTVDVMLKSLPEQNDIINFKECFAMAHALGEKNSNISMINQIVAMYASGHDGANMGPYQNVTKLAYEKPIMGNILIVDNLSKKEIQKIRKSEISKARALGHDISSLPKIDRFGNATGTIVLDYKVCTFQVKMDTSPRTGKISVTMDVILLPHQYSSLDVLALAGIIHHEARHLHDCFIHGFKQYYDENSTNNEYYQSFVEARAFSDQMVQQFLIIKRIMKVSNQEVAEIIKEQINEPESFMVKNIPSDQIKLFGVFVDAIVSNPKVISSRKEMISKSVVEENVLPENIVNKSIEKIVVLWHNFYETIISPTKIFKNITKAEGVNVDF